MPRTREQIARAAADAEAWLNSLDPDTVEVDKIIDLRVLAEAVTQLGAAEQAVADAVHAARDNGRSWGRIAAVLGVSRQSALDRFGPRQGV